MLNGNELNKSKEERNITKVKCREVTQSEVNER